MKLRFMTRNLISVIGLVMFTILAVGSVDSEENNGDIPAPLKSPSPPASKLKVTEQQFMEELNAAIKNTAFSQRGKIELTGEYDNDPSVDFYFNENESPRDAREVQFITDNIAKRMLEILMAHGHDPRKEWIMVFVHAQRREKGVTGSNVVRLYGNTHYDFNNDQLIFELVTE